MNEISTSKIYVHSLLLHPGNLLMFENVWRIRKSFNQTKIKTFAIGIRSISGSKTIEIHSSLFLSEVEASKFIKYISDENYGIII